MRGDVETFHQDGRWHNKIEGTGEVMGTYDTREEAVAAGRTAAIERAELLEDGTVEHFIRKVDGTIGERNTYPRGRDPRHIPG
ncbi:DUF2188 domain-containing protein [Crossiella sp. SN42]|uniref:DUF2188 domain-containing protein n=1 Tax=Crossiella sp. SN42 TaxID=2944808 RepID=UPI00207D4370|nr:DUF2188 domain-containing protein [Crossiella sp. SN42]MCO1575137.1 DUF2188 domain-containing protein [Crossiella sp. SN42]